MIFTSQLDVNNVACWENTAPHLTSAAMQEAVTTREGLGFQHREWELSKEKELSQDPKLCHGTLSSYRSSLTQKAVRREADTSTL